MFLHASVTKNTENAKKRACFDIMGHVSIRHKEKQIV